MTWRGWQVLMVSVVTSLATALLCVLYTNLTARQSEQRLCDLVVAQDGAYRETPPQTQAGRRVAAAIARLRIDFDCPR